MHADLVVESLADRPDLAHMLWDLSDVWPTFMHHDPMADLYYETVKRDHPAHVLVAFDAARPDVLVARAFTVPFEFPTADRPALPEGGWDTVIRWAALDRTLARTPTHVSALEIAIRQDRRGQGLAAVMLGAMRANARRLGFTELVAPVRPSGKPNEPHTPMSEYAFRTRDDGLPADPWLRVHVRAGGDVVRVCPRSMVIGGSLAEWREWTGLPFDRTGDVVVPAALVPVHASVEHNHAVYVEPNVWVHHRLG